MHLLCQGLNRAIDRIIRCSLANKFTTNAILLCGELQGHVVDLVKLSLSGSHGLDATIMVEKMGHHRGISDQLLGGCTGIFTGATKEERS